MDDAERINLRAIHLSRWSIWPDLPEDLADEDGEKSSDNLSDNVSSHASASIGYESEIQLAMKSIMGFT